MARDRMNFSSPCARLFFGKVPSLIQETKVLARSPAGFFLPAIQAQDCASPSSGMSFVPCNEALGATGCSKAARP